MKTLLLTVIVSLLGIVVLVGILDFQLRETRRLLDTANTQLQFAIDQKHRGHK